MRNMTEKAYTLSVPIEKGHWVTIVSNKPLEPRHFVILDRYLELLKEIAADSDSDEGRDAQRLDPQDDSAGPKGIAQKDPQ